MAVSYAVASTSEQESECEKWMPGLRTGSYDSAKCFFVVPAVTTHWHLSYDCRVFMQKSCHVWCSKAEMANYCVRVAKWEFKDSHLMLTNYSALEKGNK